MKQLLNILLVLVFLFSFSALLPKETMAQGGEWDVTETDEDLGYYLMFLGQKDSLGDALMKKPVVGFGRGLVTYMGDVRLNSNSITLGNSGTSIAVTRDINSFLKLDLGFMYGKITGNEFGQGNNINFQSEIYSGRVSVMYSFEHLYKALKENSGSSPKSHKAWPYVSLGLESFEYNSKGDLMDAGGNTYHYWSDGSVRNISENAANADQSIMLQRDYVYETDLRELDADGAGKYQQIAFAVPLEAGVEMDVTGRLSLRAGFSYHFNLSDKVDDLSKLGAGNRDGAKGREKQGLRITINDSGGKNAKQNTKQKNIRDTGDAINGFVCLGILVSRYGIGRRKGC